jgi:hypothetical protein
MFIERKRLRRLFDGWKAEHSKTFIKNAPWNGYFLIACQKMMKQSFGQVMEEVWEEFPNQRAEPVSGLKDVMIEKYLSKSRKNNYCRLY